VKRERRQRAGSPERTTASLGNGRRAGTEYRDRGFWREKKAPKKKAQERGIKSATKSHRGIELKRLKGTPRSENKRRRVVPGIAKNGQEVIPKMWRELENPKKQTRQVSLGEKKARKRRSYRKNRAQGGFQKGNEG